MFILMLTLVGGYRSIVLYTYDESIKGTQMLSMQLSSSQFKEAMSSSKYFSTAAEPLKFDDGYFALLEGKNTTFKLNKFDDEITCQCKAQKITTTTRITTSMKIYSTNSHFIARTFFIFKILSLNFQHPRPQPRPHLNLL